MMTVLFSERLPEPEKAEPWILLEGVLVKQGERFVMKK